MKEYVSSSATGKYIYKVLYLCPRRNTLMHVDRFEMIATTQKNAKPVTPLLCDELLKAP